MAKNVTVAGASFTGVPSVVLPQTGGGYAQFYDDSEILDRFYPVNSIYMSTSSVAPTFGGTWQEIVIPATWGDLEDGTRSYYYGTGTGTVHFWKRTS